ncbi:uncharacterized mitochondrial protein AtMg00810-like [Amaranthus tricolor]|uniref:uncharacterized mitochondrial protein AtMg00810-like n=1 Tax=Amaranthus tricolor TaxID=29722 RepID=UPI0025901004|nr:uncharacterized mitochondrial protein AtMg00810-like [Amaranthus tricolor]
MTIPEGYTQSKNDYSVFSKKTSTSITILVVYVDDIIITGDNLFLIQSTKAHLKKIFGIKDLGKLNYFLEFEVTYIDDGLVLSQHKFTTDLLHDSGLTSFKNVVSPLPLNLKLQSNDSLLYDNQPLMLKPIHVESNRKSFQSLNTHIELCGCHIWSRNTPLRQ